jgi:glycosyltransferase involved in cell wall biosynthesis
MNVSVVVSTYNRCAMLAKCICSLLQQKTNGLQYEVIIVNNNSTDRTAETVASHAHNDARIRGLFECQQGVSFGRNTGIRAAKAELIAFCDDDVYVAGNWLQAIYDALLRYADADFVGGRVLPVWKVTPPAWISATLPPLALQDLGDKPQIVSFQNPRCLISACLGVRRQAFERSGLFDTKTQRVKDRIGSTEDSDWELKIFQNGGHGVYVPDPVCYCEVDPKRMSKSYHRRWHLGHGAFHAKGRRPEYEGGSWRLLDVPSFTYRQAIEHATMLAASLVRQKWAQAFEHETILLFCLGFIRERWKSRLL